MHGRQSMQSLLLRTSSASVLGRGGGSGSRSAAAMAQSSVDVLSSLSVERTTRGSALSVVGSCLQREDLSRRTYSTVSSLGRASSRSFGNHLLNDTRFFSSTTADEKEKTEEPKTDTEDEAADSESNGDASSSDVFSSEEEEEEEKQMTREEELEEEVKSLKDQLLRSLAEAENTRRIAQRDVESARNYAVSSFAKSLLDTSDNLYRAMEAVPEDLRTDRENHPQLVSLYEGIQMTNDNFDRAMAKNGLTKFGEEGEEFDPNLHNALYEYPDEGKESGTLGQVMKTGFMLNGRVLRPAEVGVVKK